MTRCHERGRHHLRRTYPTQGYGRDNGARYGGVIGADYSHQAAHEKKPAQWRAGVGDGAGLRDADVHRPRLTHEPRHRHAGEIRLPGSIPRVIRVHRREDAEARHHRAANSASSTAVSMPSVFGSGRRVAITAAMDGTRRSAAFSSSVFVAR